MSDYYALLGVPRDADEATIKKAYRKQAMQYHPDRNGGDQTAESRFKEITEAYDVLRDPAKRRAYDRYGEAGLRGAGAGAGGFHHVDLSEALNIFMRDFGGFAGFEEAFGGAARGGPRERRGNDLRAAVRLSIDEVAKGAKKTLAYQALTTCEKCAGEGTKAGSKRAACSTCGGSGQVQRAQRSVFGQFVSVMPCPTCGGEGRIIREPCEICRGDGRVKSEHKVTVDVPAGVSGENYITLRGQGNAGPRNGPPGDLVVMLEIDEDPRFERHGDDLAHDVHLSFSQAALGAELLVPTPWGDEKLRIEPGTQAGSMMRLRGKGLPALGSGKKGDLLVRIGIWTPERLSPEMEQLLRELAKHEAASAGGRAGRSFWDRVKESLG